MKFEDMICKIAILTFSAIFLCQVSLIFVSDRLYSMSLALEAGKISTDKALNYINTAVKLNPSNANLYFRKYEIVEIKLKSQKNDVREIYINQINLLRHCIDLCPSWPAYHMYYALTLNKLRPAPNLITKETILMELEKASELKPYSKLYLDIYDRYVLKDTTI